MWTEFSSLPRLYISIPHCQQHHGWPHHCRGPGELGCVWEESTWVPFCHKQQGVEGLR